MIWDGIIGDEIVGPFLVPDGLKMNSGNCCAFLKKNFMSWLNSQNNDVKQSIIFQQENVSSHAPRFTKGWLSCVSITGQRLRDWLPQSPDLNPIENI